MESEAQRRASAKYKAKNVKQISLKFFPKDHDAYEHAKAKPRTAEYIIGLIRADMESPE